MNHLLLSFFSLITLTIVACAAPPPNTDRMSKFFTKECTQVASDIFEYGKMNCLGSVQTWNSGETMYLHPHKDQLVQNPYRFVDVTYNSVLFENRQLVPLYGPVVASNDGVDHPVMYVTNLDPVGKNITSFVLRPEYGRYEGGYSFETLLQHTPSDDEKIEAFVKTKSGYLSTAKQGTCFIAYSNDAPPTPFMVTAINGDTVFFNSGSVAHVGEPVYAINDGKTGAIAYVVAIKNQSNPKDAQAALIILSHKLEYCH